jgi:hypothetical protein
MTVGLVAGHEHAPASEVIRNFHPTTSERTGKRRLHDRPGRGLVVAIIYLGVCFPTHMWDAAQPP